jgi:O-antigen/teichoic acid export membrane protein
MSIVYGRASLWLRRAVWAIADQGLFAGANFIGSVLLARWLSPADFGAYVTGFAVFLFIGSLHSALVTEPMMVFGPSRYEQSFSQYMRTLIAIHWRGTIAVSSAACFLIAVADAFLGWRITMMSLAVGVAGPCILFTWLLRRSFYVINRPDAAALGGFAYILAMVAGFTALRSARWLSAGTAFWVMAVASLAVGGLLLRLLLDQPPKAPLSESEVAAAHWGFGRWSLLSSGLSWFPANWYLCILSFWERPDQAAHWRAAINLILPVLQANTALGVLALPILVRRRSDARQFRGALLMTFFVLVGSAAVYVLILRAFGPDAMRLLYKGKYSLEGINLWWLGAVPVAGAGSVALGGALRANEKIAQLALVNTVVAVLTVTAGSVLVAHFGLAGAVYGTVVSQVVLGFCMIFALYGGRMKAGFAASRLTTQL